MTDSSKIDDNRIYALKSAIRAIEGSFETAEKCIRYLEGLSRVGIIDKDLEIKLTNLLNMIIRFEGPYRKDSLLSDISGNIIRDVRILEHLIGVLDDDLAKGNKIEIAHIDLTIERLRKQIVKELKEEEIVAASRR